jgi:hypothetical protein
LVLLLHVLLLFALLHFLVRPPVAIPSSTARLLEMIISTARPPAPAQVRQHRQQAAPPVPSRGGEHSGAMPSFTPPAAVPDISGLGRDLFGCTPENLSNLPADQRAHCHMGFTRPDDTAVTEPSSHVRDPARRAAEMAAKNTPLRIPCTSVEEAPSGAGPVAVPMVDPACALKGALSGFGPLSGLGK